MTLATQEEIAETIKEVKEESKGSVIKGIKLLQKKMKENEQIMLQEYRRQVYEIATGDDNKSVIVSFEESVNSLCKLLF